jgi:HEPN domain-containing protein
MSDLPESFYVLQKKAESDLRTVEVLFAEDDHRLYETIAFHCQQAVEKWLKVFLIKNDKDFPRTHDLSLLISLAEEFSTDFEKYYFFDRWFGEHAVVSRYEEGSELTHELVRDFIQKVIEFRDFVLQKIK